MGRPFLASSGFVLLDREPGGGLAVTDDYLKAYLARKELVPPDEACDAERAPAREPPGRSPPPRARKRDREIWLTPTRRRTGAS